MNKYLLVLTFLLLACACNNDDDCECCEEAIYGKWEAIEFISVDSQSYSKKNNYNPVLEFGLNGKMELKLDVNSCTGVFDLEGNSELIIDAVGCTDACCDSEFSSKLEDMLVQVTQYTVCDNELQLHVPEWGWIKLKKLV